MKADQCLGKFLGTIAQKSGVSKSIQLFLNLDPTRSVTSKHQCHQMQITKLMLLCKMIGNFVKFSTSTGHFLKSIGSFVSSGRFSPFIGCDLMCISIKIDISSQLRRW